MLKCCSRSWFTPSLLSIFTMPKKWTLLKVLLNLVKFKILVGKVCYAQHIRVQQSYQLTRKANRSFEFPPALTSTSCKKTMTQNVEIMQNIFDKIMFVNLLYPPKCKIMQQSLDTSNNKLCSFFLSGLTYCKLSTMYIRKGGIHDCISRFPFGRISSLFFTCQENPRH